MQQNIRSNFDILKSYEPQLWRLGALAERYFAEDPNTSLLKLRQFAELLAQSLAARGGLFTRQEESQYELIRRLQSDNLVPREIRQVFDQIRITGNAANHALAGDHGKALTTLKLCWQLGLWFHRTFKQPDYRSGPFVPPAPPKDESAELQQELAKLREAVSEYQADLDGVEVVQHAAVLGDVVVEAAEAEFGVRHLAVQRVTAMAFVDDDAVVLVHGGWRHAFGRKQHAAHHALHGGDVLGGERASYGTALLDQLGQQLSQEFGRGFEARNLRRMLKFAQALCPVQPSAACR